MTDQRSIDRQQAILLAIESHFRMYGYAPSIREMMTDLGISSTSVAVNRLDELESRGLIRRTPGIARGICVVKAVQA